MLKGDDDIPTRHTVVVPFGMDDHFLYPNGLLRSLLLVHVMFSKNHYICVESGFDNLKKCGILREGQDQFFTSPSLVGTCSVVQRPPVPFIKFI